MSYAGAATNIIGGELQGWANVLAKQNMFDTYKRELAQQQQFRDQGAGLFQGFLGQAGPQAAATEMSQGRQAREKSYQDVAATPLSTFTPPTEQSTSSARDKAAVNMRGQERATLGAYSDWQLRQTLNDIQNREALKQLASFAGGQAGIFPLQMYKAQHSQDTLAQIGAAISSIGGGAANYAQFSQSPQFSQPQQQSFAPITYNPNTYQGDIPNGAVLNPYLAYA